MINDLILALKKYLFIIYNKLEKNNSMLDIQGRNNNYVKIESF